MPRSSPNQTLAELLSHLRAGASDERGGLSREQLAVKAGITAGALGRIERGIASPAWVTVEALCRELGVSVSWVAEQVEGKP